MAMGVDWLAWSNPVAVWWGFLLVASGANIAALLWLHRCFRRRSFDGDGGTFRIELLLLLSAAYVFGCAFRSFLPRADVQRICLFDTWLSSVFIGRSVATVAEVCFSVQWAIILHQLGRITDAETTLTVSLLVVPLIVLAQCCSWYGVLTTNYLANAIENSIWAVAFLLVGIGLCRLLPEFSGPVRWILILAIAGIAAYLAFLATVDVPMYLNRWKTGLARGTRSLRVLEGLHDARTRWVVTHDIAHWRQEIPWMS